MNGRAVLLVEDDSADVLFMRRAWKQAGHTVPLAVVGDGEKAVAYLAGSGPYADREKFPFPSLVLLDLKIPLLPGLDVLSWIRKNPGVKDLPVAVLTSSEEPGDVARARELGVLDYLIKPTKFEDLLAIVRNLKDRW
jgi:DNA-binding response OmpR family regulator